MYQERGGFRDRGSFRSQAPVNVGDELDVKIEAVGEKGDGIAKKNGFVLFVPGAKAGQEVRIRVTKVLRKVGFAEIIGESSGGGKAEKEAEEAYEDTETFGEEPSEESSAESGEAPQPSEEEQEYDEEEYEEKPSKKKK